MIYSHDVTCVMKTVSPRRELGFYHVVLMWEERQEAQAPPTEADNAIYNGLGFASYSIHP